MTASPMPRKFGATGGGRASFPFSGIPSFLRMPIEVDIGSRTAQVAVVGIPTDEGSPFMPGSRFGPRSIREHSLRFAGGSDGVYDPAARVHYLARECRDELIVDVGDVDVVPTRVDATFRNITAAIQRLVQLERVVVALGGDHAITYPIVRGYSQELQVVHFDAHLDYLPFTHGVRYSNGHALRQVRKLPHVKSIRQIGIRSLRNTERMLSDSLQDGNIVKTMADYWRDGAEGCLDGVSDHRSCYVSIDIDVLDMSLVPGCVSGEPDGMQYRELRDLLAMLAQKTRVVGFDIVEVNPLLDVPTGATSYLAAHLAIEFLGLVVQARRGALT